MTKMTLQQKEVQVQELIFNILSKAFPFTQPTIAYELSRLRKDGVARGYYSEGTMAEVCYELHMASVPTVHQQDEFGKNVHNCIVLGDPNDKRAPRIFIGSNSTFNYEGQPYDLIVTWFEIPLKDPLVTTTHCKSWHKTPSDKTSYTTRNIYNSTWKGCTMMNSQILEQIVMTAVALKSNSMFSSFIEEAGMTKEFFDKVK